MPILRDVLLRNCSLMELYLGWNKIGSKGGVEIAAGLANSFVLKVRRTKTTYFKKINIKYFSNFYYLLGS